MPSLDWVRSVVGHPEPGRVTSTGRTGYREPDMAHPQPSTTPTNTMGWKRRTWVERMASLSNFRDHVQGDIPTPDNHQPAPSTYMTLLYNQHYTLSTTRYHAPTDTWVVHGTDSLLLADYTFLPARARPPHEHQGGRAGRPPHLGLWGYKSLETLLRIRSGNQGLGRAMYCLAKWTQGSWQIPSNRWTWKVTLCPEQMQARLNRTGATAPRSDTMQLCPFMVADTPIEHYPNLTEEDMPDIQRCFFGILPFLLESNPHIAEITWTPPPG